MALTIVCPKCQQAGEHSEIYRGCMRPCPHCGEFVSLATPEDAPARLLPTEECWCGRKHDERGLHFALGYEYINKSSWLIHISPIIVLLIGERLGQREVNFIDGWACENCCGQITRLRRWFRAPWLLVPALWLACMIPLAYANKVKTTGQFGQLSLSWWGFILICIILPVRDRNYQPTPAKTLRQRRHR